MNLSVVIPAYNEGDNIKITIEEIVNVISKITYIDEIQIIVIDDHSTDNTYDIVSQMHYPFVNCLRLNRRSGSHTALRAGLMEADGDVVLCISADGQDNPSYLGEMLSKWCSGDKIVWALRNNRNNEPFFIRLLANMFYRTLFLLTRNEQPDVDLSLTDFYLLDRVVVDAINSCPERNTSLFGLIAWLGFTQGFIQYDRRERVAGSSKWSFRRRLRLAKDWIVAFSGIPLKLIIIVGFLISGAGFIFAIDVFLNYFLGNPNPGYSSIMVAVLVLGGIQMIMLGIVGEYLWRDFDESRKRPLFFIEKRTSIINE